MIVTPNVLVAPPPTVPVAPPPTVVSYKTLVGSGTYTVEIYAGPAGQTARLAMTIAFSSAEAAAFGALIVANAAGTGP